jgi:hypothetical protein
MGVVWAAGALTNAILWLWGGREGWERRCSIIQGQGQPMLASAKTCISLSLLLLNARKVHVEVPLLMELLQTVQSTHIRLITTTIPLFPFLPPACAPRYCTKVASCST